MKPCPFCGITDAPHVESWRVGDHFEYACVCQNCGAQGPADLGTFGAMEMWDMRRPEEALLQEHRAAMRAEGMACDQRLKLERALRDELAAALREIGPIVPPYGGEPFYPCCNRYGWEGHRPTCRWQAALARLEAGE